MAALALFVGLPLRRRAKGHGAGLFLRRDAWLTADLALK